MRQFFEAHKDVAELSTLLRELPWYSNLHILTKTKREEERELYLRIATRDGWQVWSLFQMRTNLQRQTIFPAPGKWSGRQTNG